MGVLNEWAREMDEESTRVSKLIDEGEKFGETTFDVAYEERKLFHALVRHAKVVKRSGLAYVKQSGDDSEDTEMFFDIVGYKMKDFASLPDIDVDKDGKITAFNDQDVVMDEDGERSDIVEPLFLNRNEGIAYYFTDDIRGMFEGFVDFRFDQTERTIAFLEQLKTIFPVSTGIAI